MGPHWGLLSLILNIIPEAQVSDLSACDNIKMDNGQQQQQKPEKTKPLLSQPQESQAA